MEMQSKESKPIYLTCGGDCRNAFESDSIWFRNHLRQDTQLLEEIPRSIHEDEDRSSLPPPASILTSSPPTAQPVAILAEHARTSFSISSQRPSGKLLSSKRASGSHSCRSKWCTRSRFAGSTRVLCYEQSEYFHGMYERLTAIACRRSRIVAGTLYTLQW